MNIVVRSCGDRDDCKSIEWVANDSKRNGDETKVTTAMQSGLNSPDQNNLRQAGEPRPLAKNIATFLAFWFACALTTYLYTFVIVGWAALLVGASRQELLENLDLLSVPLGWVNRDFVVRPGRSFTAVCGIIACNSYFYALILLPIYKFVHAALDRNRVTELRINPPNDKHESSD